MKTTRKPLLAALACGCSAVLALTDASHAAVIVSEPFTYPDGNLVGNVAPNSSTWTGLNTGDEIQVASGKATFGGAGREAYLSFTAQTSTTYYSLSATVTSLGTLGTTGGYFTALVDAAGTTNFGATIWARKDAVDGTKFNFGVSTRSSSSAISWDATARTVGTAYTLAASYNFVAGTANDTASLWINPESGESLPLFTAASPTTDLSGTNGVGKFLLRQDSTSATPEFAIDNLSIGSSLADVVPEPASLALFGLGGVALLGRRRR